MASSKIDKLHSSKENWVIEARLCRLWEAINFKNDNDVMGLEMVFVDDEGNSIQAFIRKCHMNKFKPKLEEGEVYSIKNFKVGTSAAKYQVVPNNSRIYFNASTAAVKVSPTRDDIPQNVFFFASPETHEARIGNNTMLTDIIGCVCGVGKDTNTGTGTKKEIRLTTSDGDIMKVTLWGNVSDMFGYSSYEDPDTPVVAIITSTTIRKFKGELSFNSTTATKIYFNLDIDEVRELSLRFAGAPPTITMLDTEEAVPLPLAKQMALNRTNIAELLGMEWVSDKQEYTFTLKAEVVEVEHQFGWCYVSCNQCSKKLVPEDGALLCTSCQKQCSYPIMRYKVHVRVADDTGSTTLVIFNQEAEKLLAKPASNFVDRLGIGNSAMPEDIIRLIGKTFVFKIKVTDYNLKDGFENYTVLKIFNLNDDVNAKEPGPLKIAATPVKTEEPAVDAKRKASVFVGQQSKDAGGSISGNKGSLAPVTPAKKIGSLKKLKRTA